MASSYTTAGIELIADGEQSGTWGQTTNTNWSMMEEMVTGVVSIGLTGTTYTLTTTDGVSSNGRHAVIVFTGSPGGTCTVTVSPNDMQKVYYIVNNSDQTVTITQGSGSNVSVSADKAKAIYCDGAGAAAAVNDISSKYDATTLAELGVTASASELNTLDGITATTTELNYNDITTLGTVQASKTVTADANGDVKFSDGDKLVFGGGSDLQIYHDSNNSYIEDAGTGWLYIKGNDSGVAVTDGTDQNVWSANQNGFTAYYANSAKIATASTGVSVTGAMYASGNIGLDSTDYISFTGNTRMDVTINGSNEFRFESDGDFHADGDVIAYSTTTASDERLKENIAEIQDPLDKVKRLRGVTFDWKRDGQSSAGVIAQDVMQVLPQAVKNITAMNGTDHYVVNYNAVMSILIESIKALSDRIDELESED